MFQKSFEIVEKKRTAANYHSVFCQVTDDDGYYLLDPKPDTTGPIYRIEQKFVDVQKSTAYSDAVGARMSTVRIEVGAPMIRIESTRFDPMEFSAAPLSLKRTSSNDWSWAALKPLFGRDGCSVAGCPYHRPAQDPPGIFYCALNLSDCILRAGYTLPIADLVNYCPHGRARNADGMARIVKNQNGGSIDHSGWDDRPTWNGIVFFAGGPSLSGATGHIDLYDGTKQDALHASYPDATTVWFWQLGA